MTVTVPGRVPPRLTLYGHSRREVLDKLVAAQGQVRQGLVPASSKLTVARHVAAWLLSVERTVRPTTWAGYESRAHLIVPYLGAVPLVRLTPNDVRLWRDRLLDEALAPRTVVTAMTVLRMALRQAQRDGLVARNVASLAELPTVSREPLRILTAAEARKLLVAARDDPMGAMWVLLVGCGLRLGEALGLRWQDLDLASASLAVTGSLQAVPRQLRQGKRLQRVAPKTEAGRRTIALPAFVTTALSAHRERTRGGPVSVEGYVFTTPNGTPLDHRRALRAWRAFSTATGLPAIRIHDLRHTCASLLLSQGYTLEDVKRVLGHESIVVTSDTYGHLVEGRSRQLAQGMDELLASAITWAG